MSELEGRVVLITGGARGMGRITAQALAARGAQVIVADWEGEQGTRTVAEINASGRGRAEFIYCNLSEPDSVRELAARVLQRHERLHVLINNAGITYPRRQLNSAGLEMHFATIHLGHFLLTQLLLERLRASAPARILFVASEGHKAARGLDFDDLNNERIWKGAPLSHSAAFMAYARAKLCNILVTRELAARLEGSGVTVNAISPGYFVNTGIHREMHGVFRLGAGLVFGLGSLLGLGRPERAARTHIWAASASELEHVSGKYFQACREIAAAPEAADAAAGRRLWAISEAMISL